MSKIVQINGGIAQDFKFYVGALREVTADTTNWELRLHNNVTPGGIRFLNLTQNDNRYQARSEELDGFDFGPNGKGWLTRVSPGVYKLREFLPDTANFQITNPRGLVDNPTFGLAQDITSDHNFSGEITFQEVSAVRFIGPLTGNVTGNVTGDVTGNLTGDVTGDLLGNTFGTHTGNLDTSEGEVLMADGQIQLPWLDSEITDLFVTRGIPYGGAVFWCGTLEDIPTGWALCDGTNGTPDLKKFFIRCAAPDLLPHTTGGANTHDHAVDSGGSHSHAVTVGEHILTTAELPVHKHGNGVVDKNDNLFNHGGLNAVPTKGDSIDGNSSTGDREGYTTEVGGGQAHTHEGSGTDTSGAHTHARAQVTDESNIPEYYSLALIMKVV